jgi:hypothetical protein
MTQIQLRNNLNRTLWRSLKHHIRTTRILAHLENRLRRKAFLMLRTTALSITILDRRWTGGGIIASRKLSQIQP